MKNKKKLVLFLAISALIVIGLRAWDDEKLFTTIAGGKGKPNVILVQDRTGSMCSIIYHPDFNVKDSTLDGYSRVEISNLGNDNSENIDRTSWYIRWFATPTTINNSSTYATGHTFTSTGTATGTLLTGSEGVNIKVGDWILQYDPNDTLNLNHQAIGRVTAISAPDGNRFFTLTLADIKGTFVHDYRLYVWASTATLPSGGYDSGTKKLQVTGDLRSYFAPNDYIMLFDNDDIHNTGRQAVARITAESYSSSSGRTTFTLADIIGTISVTGTQDRIYYRKTAETRLVKLYGTALDQESSTNYITSYAMDGDRYLKWIFGRADALQRQQVTDFSTLGYDVEYNGYLCATPVRPDLAYALKPDNSNSDTTLLAEWNTVMKDMYPNRIANLKDDPINTTATTINYHGAKDSFKNYQTGPFYIKIDAETMRVDTNTPNTTDPLKAGEGQLTVVRAQKNTVAAAHPFGSAIMIYDNSVLGIDESTPEISLFSSMQHVTEATGDVDPTWTELRTIGTSKNCWRYKRVFTRIQVAREALCDVITAKNKLLKTAELIPAVDDTVTVLNYYNPTASFLTRVAPFFIKVSDANNPDSDEIMKVTAHDPDLFTLTVVRGQQGTAACAHANYSAIMTFSGARDLVRFGIFTLTTADPDNPAEKRVDLNDFGKKDGSGQYLTTATQTINDNILDKVNAFRASGATPLARALAYVWNYLKPNPGTGVAGYINTANYKAVDSTTFGTNEKFETIDGVTHPQGSPMEYWCQENYVVMVTDGDSNTDDDLLTLGVFSQANQKTTVAGGIVSDFFKFNYNRSTYPTPWGDTVNDGSEYLTDVAYYGYHQDMFPTTKIKTGTWDTTNKIFSSGTPEADATLYDEKNTDWAKQWPGNQNMKTYAVGLCLANTVLPKAAKNGGGASYTASNYRDLSEAFLNILTSVALAQDPMTYTTYAAPKQSIAEGNYGYIAHFVPRERAMWEGHLRRYRLSYNGDFTDNIDSETAMVYIDKAQTLQVISFQWDAAKLLEARTAEGVASDRVVYTSQPNVGETVWYRKNFMDDEIDNGDLAVSTDAQRLQVKKFIQNFQKTDNSRVYPKQVDPPQPALLGETFHFNPQLVSLPLAWKGAFDLSYKSFYDHYSTGTDRRKEVVYTGGNDGKLHCFDSVSGSELWSYVPFSHLTRLKIPALSPLLTTSHTYFVDGKSLAKDIKVGSSGTYLDWKTGLFFGMGIGGRSYCALDVTNPLDLKVLWETTDSAEDGGYMGFTEAKPAIVDMYAGSTLGTFPAAVLAGGYNAAEVQATDMTAQEWQRQEGKALYILNANTGAEVKKFRYGADDSNSATLEINSDFRTAMTAAPAILDKNNDGIADVMYLAESGDYRVTGDPDIDHGGAIWKINCYGNPATWEAEKIYQAPAGTNIFISPSLAYDKDARVWILFGTGRRPRPVEGSTDGTFTNKTGQFVAFIDDNSGTCITNDDLSLAEETEDGVTSIKEGEYTIDDNGTIKKGFYFNFYKAHEIMFEPQPLYIKGRVYFMTLAPEVGEGSEGTTGDPCGGTSRVNGKHYLYEFDLTSKGNTFVIGNVSYQSAKILGYGPMEKKIKLYIGPGDAGNFRPNPTGGDIELEDNFGAMLWKEEKR